MLDTASAWLIGKIVSNLTKHPTFTDWAGKCSTFMFLNSVMVLAMFLSINCFDMKRVMGLQGSPAVGPARDSHAS